MKISPHIVVGKDHHPLRAAKVAPLLHELSIGVENRDAFILPVASLHKTLLILMPSCSGPQNTLVITDAQSRGLG